MGEGTHSAYLPCAYTTYLLSRCSSGACFPSCFNEAIGLAGQTVCALMKAITTLLTYHGFPSVSKISAYQHDVPVLQFYDL
jgi:hypothetical protein